MSKQSNIDHLRLCALWYGYGQTDATPTAYVDANAFASYYADLVTAMEEGRTSFLPSIQNAWQQFMRPIGPEQPLHMTGFQTCQVCGIRRTTTVLGDRVSRTFRYPADTESLWLSGPGMNCRMMGEHEWGRMELPDDEQITNTPDSQESKTGEQ